MVGSLTGWQQRAEKVRPEFIEKLKSLGCRTSNVRLNQLDTQAPQHKRH